jgi:uncharacterized Tic20 family protein
MGGVAGPLVVWLMQKNESEFVEEHAREALNFGITMLIAFIVSGVLCLVLIGIPMLIACLIMSVVWNIQGAIKASNGAHYRYPFCIRFLSKT